MRRISWPLVGADLILALLALLIGAQLRFGVVEALQSPEFFGAVKVVPFVLVGLVSGFFCELYSAEYFQRGAELAARVAVEMMTALLLLSMFYFLLPGVNIGRGFLSLSLFLFGLQQFLLRRGLLSLGRLSGFTQRILILGVGSLADTLSRTMEASNGNYELAGFVQSNGADLKVPAAQVVGEIDEIGQLIARYQVTDLVLALNERRGVLPVRELLTCKLEGVNILDAPCFYEKMTGKLLVENIQPSWFIFSSGFRNTPLRMFVKRSLDVAGAVFGLLLTLPLLPLVALAIKLDSKGPVLFKQCRVGAGGREFFIYKFRTMCQDAEKQTGAVWAVENDPRVTRLGAFLRKSRLDELPQLYNVLRGDMSFVGPRPERPEFVSQLSETIPYYAKRHFMKPGVTGWAQICYPYGASEKDALEKLRYDLYYIKNYSLVLDFSILLETIKTVIYGRGGR